MSEPFCVYSDVGADGYPPEWHRLDHDDLGIGLLTTRAPGIKDLVREQAGHRCERCGHPYRKGDGEWSACDSRCDHDPPQQTLRVFGGGLFMVNASRWRILTVHHLNGDKADCRWWNLAALCQRCHLRIQQKVQMERVWPWAHSSWFALHAAGWYAHAYLGEELDREQTRARLDELLALERVA